MKKIGLFYGPTGGSTEKTANLIKQAFGDYKIDVYPIKDSSSSMVNQYDIVIMGCSTIGTETWNSQNHKNDWDGFRPEIDKIDINGKVFAFFGTGNHLTYARHFVDGMGILAKLFIVKGAQITGQCNTEDYEFIESEAIVNGKFIGLPIDEDFEPEKTKTRIDNWVKELKSKLL